MFSLHFRMAFTFTEIGGKISISKFLNNNSSYVVRVLASIRLPMATIRLRSLRWGIGVTYHFIWLANSPELLLLFRCLRRKS